MKQKITIRFQTYNKKNFQNFFKSINDFAIIQNLNASSISLPMQKKKITVLKSPHVNKKAKDQFELRLYNGLIVLKQIHENISDKLLQGLKTYFHDDVVIKISVSN